VVTTDYASNDAVSMTGSSYYAAGDPSLGVQPPAAPWQQIAAKGDTGPQGPQGATGATGSQGPQGNVGPQGPVGSTGATGPAGPGVPAGGTTAQMLVKTSATDYATAWTSFLDVAEIAKPANPAAGFVRLYAKADHGLYILDSTGVERRLDVVTLEGTVSYA